MRRRICRALADPPRRRSGYEPKHIFGKGIVDRKLGRSGYHVFDTAGGWGWFIAALDRDTLDQLVAMRSPNISRAHIGKTETVSRRRTIGISNTPLYPNHTVSWRGCGLAERNGRAVVCVQSERSGEGKGKGLRCPELPHDLGGARHSQIATTKLAVFHYFSISANGQMLGTNPYPRERLYRLAPSQGRCNLTIGKKRRERRPSAR